MLERAYTIIYALDQRSLLIGLDHIYLYKTQLHIYGSHATACIYIYRGQQRLKWMGIRGPLRTGSNEWDHYGAGAFYCADRAGRKKGSYSPKQATYRAGRWWQLEFNQSRLLIVSEQETSFRCGNLVALYKRLCEPIFLHPSQSIDINVLHIRQEIILNSDNGSYNNRYSYYGYYGKQIQQLRLLRIQRRQLLRQQLQLQVRPRIQQQQQLRKQRQRQLRIRKLGGQHKN
jgi:hypothetical protein